MRAQSALRKTSSKSSPMIARATTFGHKCPNPRCTRCPETSRQYSPVSNASRCQRPSSRTGSPPAANSKQTANSATMTHEFRSRRTETLKRASELGFGVTTGVNLLCYLRSESSAAPPARARVERNARDQTTTSRFRARFHVARDHGRRRHHRAARCRRRAATHRQRRQGGRRPREARRSADRKLAESVSPRQLPLPQHVGG